MNLQGKIIIIAGATGGIGEELSRRLHKECSYLILLGRREEKLKSLKSELRDKCEYFVVDFKSKEGISNYILQLKGKYKSIDVLIHVAGIGAYKTFEETTRDDWDESFDINTKAPYFLTQGLLPIMNSNDSLVLTVGSGAGVIPMRGRSLYCATKFALRGMTLSLAEEFKGFNPSFCLITLGSTLTEFGPMTLEEKKKESESGKAYFTPGWVAEKLVEIIKNENREVEYTLYPTDYNLGHWEKP
ncbi:hypothetical protein A2690_02190 [Candidatus Roizmanbacteria bacterium RIFCSPHIGHO2_01_FULL_39_12b]|uniref:Short-chain dehydrogenase n=1 Tax=Candidatus Roizmanbacteria bacterium RIFCSPHIGHO2_01_FULL_39_12b TaxID=1802030 RepID=A0A1F7GEF2_9BACT|nr:MAG: hypothetical protein A2690_02190 [Candidatus Roizmanbacteria bacterium RIFCSPHIGHO2_01_FULL_39_12b]OGK47049.1 MAG: hypothetical protein A3B46_01440 [Candidatus Roizmanbacteria bacterium RIFCSPLOWO2_01_FULL_39_19]